MNDVTVIGGGLAGSEAAWQAAQRGLRVDLYEMRPLKTTGAHLGADLAELICSNSLGSNLIDRASGLLKEEIRRMGSLLLECAAQSALPAGNALAVDREQFAALVTARISAHPNIRIVREEVSAIPSGPVVVASGPLTSPALSAAIIHLTGQDHLFFFDAIAPIVRADSIDMQIAFRASRYGVGEQVEGDYINCPLTRQEYDTFVTELRGAQRINLHAFEEDMHTGVTAGSKDFFEGCLPVEIIAQRGPETLAYGPMRPVGLKDPRTNRHPYAVLQLRQDNLAATLYNLVGFQTNLTFAEQKRVFRLVPGLNQAEFVRYGQMHRNTFIASPLLLLPTLQFSQRADLFYAGQITGVEGYMGNIATGLLAGMNVSRLLQGASPLVPPQETMIGALLHYITHASLRDFQPMKAMFGLLPPLADAIKSKRDRAREYSKRGILALEAWAQDNQIPILAGEKTHEEA
jgi:methylenetetrahydrofolate--tRNA-(uracil-5-)-methyltransferase